MIPVLTHVNSAVHVIPKNSGKDKTILELTGISVWFEKMTAVLEYNLGNDWLPMTIQPCDQSPNHIIIQCSAAGEISRVEWLHTIDGVACGSNVRIRARQAGAPVLFGWSGTSSVFEGGALDDIAILGTNNEGQWMGREKDTGDFVVYDEEVILRIPLGCDALQAWQKPNGHYVILASESPSIREYNEEGVLVRSYFSSVVHFQYNSDSGNILLSLSGAVQEHSWDLAEGENPTKIREVTGLSNPTAACYLTQNRWGIVDAGQKKALVKDWNRNTLTEDTSITVDERAVPLENPWMILPYGDSFIVIDKCNNLTFSSDPANHVPLERSKGNSPPALKNLTYAPVLRGIR